MSHEEIWRVVPSQPEIAVSSWGRVKRLTRARVGPISQPTFGRRERTFRAGVELPYHRRVVRYMGVGLFGVARLVCETFNGPAPFPGAQVLHLDDDTDNNRPENLRWGSQHENMNTGRFRDLCRARTFQRDANGRIVSMTPALQAKA